MRAVPVLALILICPLLIVFAGTGILVMTIVGKKDLNTQTNYLQAIALLICGLAWSVLMLAFILVLR